MARVKITMYRDVLPSESDPDDDTGLTEEAYNEVMAELLGFEDIEIEKADD